MSKQGYILFMAEPPLFGLTEHPAAAPDADMTRFNAEGFSEAYRLFDTFDAAGNAAIEDYLEVLEAEKDGDLQDAGEMDIPRPVRVHNDGSVEIFADGFKNPATQHYTAEEIFDSYGLDVPEPSDPSEPTP